MTQVNPYLRQQNGACLMSSISWFEPESETQFGNVSQLFSKVNYVNRFQKSLIGLNFDYQCIFQRREIGPWRIFQEEGGWW